MLQHGIPELPEYISVQTCLIGREAARLHNLEGFDFSNLTSINQKNHFQSESLPTSIPITVPIVPAAPILSPYTVPAALKTHIDSEMNTDGPNPMRDRALQTELLKTISIGIQCNAEADLEQNDFQETLAVAENIDDYKKRFIEFVKINTRKYGNGKFECILCGEIKNNPKHIASHIAIHWGPPKLCVRCGLQFEHAVFWKTHNCVVKRKKATFQYIKCPHVSCGVNAISPTELNEHLNEHCGLRPHQCVNCKKSFATFAELRLHRKLHEKCSKVPMNDIYKEPMENTMQRKRTFIFKTVQGKRLLVKTFLTQISKRKRIIKRYCSVCLKRCKNIIEYKQHTKRCLEQHKRRLKRKRDFTSELRQTNGVNGEISS